MRRACLGSDLLNQAVQGASLRTTCCCGLSALVYSVRSC